MPRNLRKIRKDKGLTIKDLADAVGIGASTIGNYETETSQMSKDTLMKIAEHLKVSVDEITGVSTLREPSELLKDSSPNDYPGNLKHINLQTWESLRSVRACLREDDAIFAHRAVVHVLEPMLREAAAKQKATQPPP